MADHRHHHHHHHHRQEETPVYPSQVPGYGMVPEGSYGGYPSQVPGYGMVPEGSYGGYYPGTVATSYPAAYPAPYRSMQVAQMPPYEDYYRQEENKHKHREHAAELGAVAAGGFALYERHQIKSDPEHAHRHKIEEEVAAAAAVAAGGYAVYEHHEKKKFHRAEEEASGNKHHHHRHGHHLF